MDAITDMGLSYIRAWFNLGGKIAILFLLGCTPRYAEVYVKTVDVTSGTSVSLNAKSGDGLDLGITPFYYRFTRWERRPEVPFCVIVYDQCYPAQVQVVRVARWAKTKAEAHDASYTNNVSFEVRKINGCQ